MEEQEKIQIEKKIGLAKQLGYLQGQHLLVEQQIQDLQNTLDLLQRQIDDVDKRYQEIK